MADHYLLESSVVDGFLLENGSGVILLDKPIVKVIDDVLQIVESTLHPKRIRQIVNETLELLSVTIDDIESAIIQIINETVSTIESTHKFITTTAVKKCHIMAIRIKNSVLRRIRQR